LGLDWKVEMVFLVYWESVVLRGLERFLSGTELEVTPVDLKEPGSRRVLGKLRRGDVVVMDRGDKMASYKLRVYRLFSRLPEVTVINLDPRENKVSLISQEERQVTSLEELAQIILQYCR